MTKCQKRSQTLKRFNEKTDRLVFPAWKLNIRTNEQSEPEPWLRDNCIAFLFGNFWSVLPNPVTDKPSILIVPPIMSLSFSLSDLEICLTSFWLWLELSYVLFVCRALLPKSTRSLPECVVPKRIPQLQHNCFGEKCWILKQDFIQHLHSDLLTKQETWRISVLVVSWQGQRSGLKKTVVLCQ